VLRLWFVIFISGSPERKYQRDYCVKLYKLPPRSIISKTPLGLRGIFLLIFYVCKTGNGVFLPKPLF